MNANPKPMEEMMKVETNYELIADNGRYVGAPILIYDRKDGQFVGEFRGFSGDSIVIRSMPGSCCDSDRVSGFPLECVEGWTEEPLPTKPPAIWPESLRRFFRAAHKSEDAKQIALALKAVDLWTREEIGTELDEIPF